MKIELELPKGNAAQRRASLSVLKHALTEKALEFAKHIAHMESDEAKGRSLTILDADFLAHWKRHREMLLSLARQVEKFK